MINSVDADSWPLLIAFIFFVIFGAYFAGAESAYSAMNAIRIRALASDGDKRANKALQISLDFERAITTLLIGNNLTHIAASSLATILFLRVSQKIGGMKNVALWSTLITTAIVFLFCEMIPKSLANDRAETLSLAFAPSMKFFMKLFRPVASFFMRISSFVTNLFDKDDSPTMTEEELHEMIDTLEEEEVLDEDESDLFKSALDFSGTLVKDIMTVKSDISALDINSTTQEIIDFIKQSSHSRVPVYENTIDNIVGILITRDYIKAYLSDPDVRLRDYIIDVFYSKPDMPIDDLLNHMRSTKKYISIVRDDKGRTLGLVTIEDFLEELVGEIWDEDDVFDKDFVKLGGNRFRLSPRMLVSEAFTRIGYKPRETKPFMSKPIISWLVETLRHIPEEGDAFVYDRLEVTVEEVDGTNVKSVVIWLKPRGENS